MAMMVKIGEEKQLEDMTMEELNKKLDDGTLTFGELERILKVFNDAKGLAELTAKIQKPTETPEEEVKESDECAKYEIEGTLKKLIGYRLVSFDITKREIVVSKDGVSYILTLEEDEGDCCGYNELTGVLHMYGDDTDYSPIITDVTYEKKETDDYDDQDVAKITFFGAEKTLASLTSTSSSGSGWQYGACVTIKCDALNIKEIVSEW